MIYGFNRKEGTERQTEDFYATHPSAIPPLLDILDWKEPKRVWECAAGQGHLSEALKLYGHDVLSTDLIDRGYGIAPVNFLENTPYDNMQFAAIITNPPYKFAIEFVKKSIELAPVACHFLRLAFLESSKRKEFFKECPPRYVAVFSERVPCSKNGLFPKDESSAVCYAWFIWEKGFKGRPEILWI